MPRFKRIFKKRKNVGRPRYPRASDVLIASTVSVPNPSACGGSDDATQNSTSSPSEYKLSNPLECLAFVDLNALTQMVKGMAVCGKCSGKLDFSFTERCGLKVKTALFCTECNASGEYVNTSVLDDEGIKIAAL